MISENVVKVDDEPSVDHLRKKLSQVRFQKLIYFPLVDEFLYLCSLLRLQVDGC